MARKLPEFITEEEFRKLFKATKHEHHKLAFALGFYQAMRISEVVNLLPENIDFSQRLIRIKEAKGKKDRNIPIAPQVITGLRKGIKNKLIPMKCDIRALQIAFKKALKKAGIERDLHFHNLRHGGATYYLNEKGWDVSLVSNFLGHSRLDTTQIYIHLSPKNLIDKMWEE